MTAFGSGLAIVLLLSGCTAQPADTATTFVAAVEEVDYRCVETTPPTEDVILLRSCQDPAGMSITFTLYDSQESRRSGESSVDPEEATVAHEAWLIVGEDETLVRSVGLALGAPGS